MFLEVGLPSLKLRITTEIKLQTEGNFLNISHKCFFWYVTIKLNSTEELNAVHPWLAAVKKRRDFSKQKMIVELLLLEKST